MISPAAEMHVQTLHEIIVGPQVKWPWVLASRNVPEHEFIEFVKLPRQVQSLQDRGIAAARLGSDGSKGAEPQVFADLAAGNLQLLHPGPN